MDAKVVSVALTDQDDPDVNQPLVQVALFDADGNPVSDILGRLLALEEQVFGEGP
jgi:hypothetical protein